MHDRRFALAACLVPLFVSCGSPSAPTQVPDVRGSWGAGALSWRWSEGFTASPDITHSSTCQGALDIVEQDGGAFAGRFAISCPAAGASSGTVIDGRVSLDGRLSFRLQSGAGWDPAIPPGWFNPPCRLSADTALYEGTVTSGSMSVRRVQDFECPTVSTRVIAAFEGSRP
jgi:hypothetical protein